MKTSLDSRLIAVAAAAALAGCAAHQKAAESKTAAQTPPPALSTANPIETGEPTMRNSILHEISELKTIAFPYDSDALTDAARSTLGGNARWLKDHPDVRVQVAGHCDDRGTVEYNLALGQRRAASARKYYRMLGIAGKRIATISYGKERQVCGEASEECWARNRRADTLGAFPADISRRP